MQKQARNTTATKTKFKVKDWRYDSNGRAPPSQQAGRPDLKLQYCPKQRK
jgi:hypothetical protein